jgi:Ca-activated chloride channel homolog
MNVFGRRPVHTVLWLTTSLAVGGLLFWAYRKFVLLHTDPTLSWVYEGTRFELLDPRMLGAVLLAPWFIFILSRSLADLPWPQRVLSVLLRIAFVVLIALGMSRLARTATTQKVATVYIVDVSDSVPDEALGDAREVVDKARGELPEDGALRLITFAKRPRVVDLEAAEAEGNTEIPIERHRNAAGETADLGAGTNLQAALQLAYGLFPPGYLKRVVILSDGVQTDGDLLSEVNRAADFGVRVFTIPYRRPVPGEVAVTEFTLPEKVNVGETFEVRANVYASRKTKARARLYQGETLNGLEGVRELDLAPGPNDVVFKSVVRFAGQVTYELKLDQIADDKFAENNEYATTVDVPGRPSVLYIEGTPEHAQPLSSALTAQQFDVDVRSAVGFPGSLKELERFDFLIVSDVPKEAMSLQSQDLVERYVRDLGGGFLFAGGENGYGLGGWYRSTIEKILPVRMDNEKKKEMPSVAMSLVMDRSGSMTGLPIEMAKEAAKATVEVLAPDDLVGVIAFDSAPQRYVKLQPARNRTRIMNDIARIQPGGGTEIFSALDAAYQDMTVVQARRKHVILLTDGKLLAERHPRSGERHDRRVDHGDDGGSRRRGRRPDAQDDRGRGGRALPLGARPEQPPRIFTKETEMIARAAAVEEWFPVTQVGSAQFLRGVDVGTAPYLHGYVSTQMKPAPAEELLTSDTAEPILARWRVGLGWTLAWTSDVKARWAVEWLRWPGFEKFWGQLVHEHMRQKHTRELDMKAEIVGGELRASVDAFTPDERFENGLESKLSIIGPEPGGDTRVVDLRQIAPGRYEVDTPLDKFGSFLLRAEHLREQPDGTVRPVAVSYGHVSNPYPREYATFEPDLATLERAAIAARGKMDPEGPGAVFDPAGEEVEYHEQLWSRFIFAAIAVFLLDLLVRRVRIFDRKFIPKRRHRAA